MKRFQLDGQWQRDLYAMTEARSEHAEHIATMQQLHAAGAEDEAAREVRLADEAQERIDMLHHALKDFR